MKIYINKDFLCFTESADDRKECECSFFDGKSARFIEGYRYVPSGESWARDDGKIFYGEMIAPTQNPVLLDLYDREQKLQDSVTANSEYIVQMELDKAMGEMKNAI